MFYGCLKRRVILTSKDNRVQKCYAVSIYISLILTRYCFLLFLYAVQMITLIFVFPEYHDCGLIMICKERNDMQKMIMYLYVYNIYNNTAVDNEIITWCRSWRLWYQPVRNGRHSESKHGWVNRLKYQNQNALFYVNGKKLHKLFF